MSKKVTLREVAKYCGVSPMTVSHVVREIHCVKESTRKKVERAIRKLGYQVDPAMRALAAHRTRLSNQTVSTYKATLAFFDSEPSEYSLSIFEQCHQEGKKRGYDLTYFQLPRTHEEQSDFSKRLWAQGIRGILLGPAQKNFDLGGFEFDRFAIVGVGAFQHSPSVDSVRPDYFQGLYTAAQHCVEYGYKNIALLVVDFLEARTGHRWLGAYHAFCHHYDRKPILWIFNDESWPSTKELAHWIQKNEIDAVLTLSGIIPLAKVFSKLRQVFLNDWLVTPGAWCIKTPRHLIARESLSLLDSFLILQKFGVPESPKQISIKSYWNGPAGS